MLDSSGDDWLTINQTAALLDRSRKTIERWLRTGLPSQRVRGTRYIRKADAQARLRLIIMTEPEHQTRRLHS